MKVPELKKVLHEGLDHLKTFYGDPSLDDLKDQVEKTSDPYTLFRMLQSFREVLGAEDTSFKVSLKDGTIKVFKNLSEADAFFGGNNE